MTSIRILFRRLLSLFRKQNLEQELDAEIRSHLEMLIEDYQRQGMTAAEARLRRSPGTTIVAILSLAFGIGVNTALFSAVDAVLLQSLPVREPDRLIVFEWQAGRPFRVNGLSGTSNISVPPGHRGFSLFHYEVFTEMNRARLRESNDPLSDLFAFGPLNQINARFTEQAELIDGQAVTGNYYAGLGIQPILGRAITDQDDRKGAQPVVVLSNKLWREQFSGNPEVIGQELSLNNKSFTIVGVDPPSFTGALQVDFQPAVTKDASVLGGVAISPVLTPVSQSPGSTHAPPRNPPAPRGRGDRRNAGPAQTERSSAARREGLSAAPHRAG